MVRSFVRSMVRSFDGSFVLVRWFVRSFDGLMVRSFVRLATETASHWNRSVRTWGRGGHFRCTSLSSADSTGPTMKTLTLLISFSSRSEVVE